MREDLINSLPKNLINVKKDIVKNCLYAIEKKVEKNEEIIFTCFSRMIFLNTGEESFFAPEIVALFAITNTSIVIKKINNRLDVVPFEKKINICDITDEQLYKRKFFCKGKYVIHTDKENIIFFSKDKYLEMIRNAIQSVLQK